MFYLLIVEHWHPWVPTKKLRGYSHYRLCSSPELLISSIPGAPLSKTFHNGTVYEVPISPKSPVLARYGYGHMVVSFWYEPKDAPKDWQPFTGRHGNPGNEDTWNPRHASGDWEFVAEPFPMLESVEHVQPEPVVEKRICRKQQRLSLAQKTDRPSKRQKQEINEPIEASEAIEVEWQTETGSKNFNYQMRALPTKRRSTKPKKFSM